MRRLLHLSDLHFGRLHRPALESLKRFIDDRWNTLSLVVVTGDWTQRARSAEFREARDFIRTLTVPVLSVPGNHDIPLYDFWTRIWSPYDKYEDSIGAVAVDSYMDDQLAVLGISTVNPWHSKEGYLRRRQIREAEAFVHRVGPERVKVLAIHHPLHDRDRGKWMLPGWRARRLMEGFDVVLSGHGHRADVRELTARGRRILSIEAGSGTSSRLRGEVNSFHVLEIEDGGIAIETYDLTEEGFVQVRKKERAPFGARSLELG